MPSQRWESVIANLVQLQAPKVLLLMWTTNIDLRMRVELLELFAGEAKVSQAFREAGIPYVSAYTKNFGKKLLSLWEEEKVASTPRLCLRQKLHISEQATDKELFRGLELGDTWAEAEMVQVWSYLYNNKRLHIPDCWLCTMDAFNDELRATVSCINESENV
ncbi:unnamed protein product [Symbiodinium sp. CCMP2456]|nr:unnamed protein product [Symbiodinium sp. CCMP2456]